MTKSDRICPERYLPRFATKYSTWIFRLTTTLPNQSTLQMLFAAMTIDTPENMSYNFSLPADGHVSKPRRFPLSNAVIEILGNPSWPQENQKATASKQIPLMAFVILERNQIFATVVEEAASSAEPGHCLGNYDYYLLQCLKKIRSARSLCLEQIIITISKQVFDSRTGNHHKTLSSFHLALYFRLGDDLASSKALPMSLKAFILDLECDIAREDKLREMADKVKGWKVCLNGGQALAFKGTTELNWDAEELD